MNAIVQTTQDWPCPVCGGKHYTIKYDLRVKHRKMAIPGWIVRCDNCHMWFKVLSEGFELEQQYGEEYSKHSVDSQYMEGDDSRAFFAKVLSKLESEQAGKKLSLLDVGAGTGTFVWAANSQGFDAQGIDLCQGLVDLAQQKGLNVKRMDVADLAAEQQFDVISMMDLIEHVCDPLEMLKKVYAGLKPGGRVIVFTPNHDSSVVWIAKLMASCGVDFALREIFGSNHVCFFDDRSLRRCLNEAGFDIEQVWKFPYDPRRPGQPMSAVELIGATASDWVGYPFGKVFRMVFYARKPL